MAAAPVGRLVSPPFALWVAPVSNLAGVARHFIDVARVGIPGWRIIYAAPEGPLLEELRSVGVPVLAVEIQPGVPVARAARNLRRLVTRVRPRLVHSHLARADILNALATAGLPVKLVSTEHHISPDRLMFHSTATGARAMELVHHLRLRKFAEVIAVSDSTRRDMEKYWRPRPQVTVIRNGVDRPAAPVVREPGLRFLSLTRLSHEKNVEMTIRCFARIRAEYPAARLTVAGAGPQRDELVAAAVRLGVDGQVDFPGFVDAATAMAEHDVLLQPSRSDNLSYTLLDAVAQGMGVTASPIGGNPEILPAHCIAPLEDDGAFVRIAIEQALTPARRPSLPDSIPTVAGMTSQIAGRYASLWGA